MTADQMKFRQFVSKLGRDFGPQGWWPRIVSLDGEVAVKHHAGPKKYWLARTPADQAFEVAVGAILTQNTAWSNVEKALVCLAEKGLMTSAALSKARLPSIESCVRASGYYHQKAKKLKLLARFVEQELGGDLHALISFRRKSERRGTFDLESLPRTSRGRSLRVSRDDVLARDILLSQWGIGPETADTVLLYGLDDQIFVVDAYTRRLLAHLTGDGGWLKRPYDEVRAFCEGSIPCSVAGWQEAHALIVKWGKSDKNKLIPAVAWRVHPV